MILLVQNKLQYTQIKVHDQSFSEPLHYSQQLIRTGWLNKGQEASPLSLLLFALFANNIKTARGGRENKH